MATGQKSAIHGSSVCSPDAGSLPTSMRQVRASASKLPPAAGFVGKLELFRAGIVVGSPSLVVLLVVGSALSLVYMFQVYQRRFWRADPSAQVPASSLPLRLLTAVVALIVLAAGLWPEPLLAVSDRAAEALLAGVPTV